MNLALNLAKKNIGATSLNPTVGCVIVKDKKILTTGITSNGGRPHAEQNAIAKLQQKDLEGSTLYVTLEPCFHFGQTPPCVDLIIKSKIEKVVIACQDPDPRVNGKSIKKLQENNIEVVVGIEKEKAIEINAGFFKAKLEKMPFVTLKLATAIDGKIATKNFDSKWITSDKSRIYAHYLRARNDAILVGSNTLEKDNPQLDCRIEGLNKLSPIKIILSNKLDIDINKDIFSKNTNYIATNNKDLEKQNLYLKRGVNIIQFSNLTNLLNNLVNLGINNLLIEGGSEVSGAFLKENLIDKIIHFQAPKIIGNDGISAISDLNILRLENSLNFQKVKSRNFGQDQVTTYKKQDLLFNNII